jgi:protein phosphatase
LKTVLAIIKVFIYPITRNSEYPMNSSERVHLHIKTPLVVASGISDPGRVRSENQDTIYLAADGHFFLLADGMGGHEKGAEAGLTAVNVIREYLSADLIKSELKEITNVDGVPREIIGVSSLIDKGINKANKVLFERNQREGLERYMGATVVGLVFMEENFIVCFHVGDSRLYRWRNSLLECLTRDHSAYNDWIRKGEIGDEPAKNIVTRAVGPKEGVVAEIKWEKRQKDDVYILCSDGLNDMLTDEQISNVLRVDGEVDSMTEELMRTAISAGGKDNISVILCRV